VTTYVAMGDSFTAGFEPGKPRWPDELADALGPGVRYENVAVVGATSEQVEREQLPRAVELRPDLVTLVCGANDVLDSTRPDPDAYGVRLSRMFARLRHGARHLGAAGEYPHVLAANRRFEEETGFENKLGMNNLADALSHIGTLVTEGSRGGSRERTPAASNSCSRPASRSRARYAGASGRLRPYAWRGKRAPPRCARALPGRRRSTDGATSQARNGRARNRMPPTQRGRGPATRT
jgi:hypothetical protein